MKRCLRVPLTFYRRAPRSEILYCSSRVEGQTPTDPPHAPPSSCPLSPTHPTPSPMDTTRGSLHSHTVQQPSLDYVSFLGFFEVSFSLSDIRFRPLIRSEMGGGGWGVQPPHCLPESTQTPFLSLLMLFLGNHVRGKGGGGRRWEGGAGGGWGVGGWGFITVKKKRKKKNNVLIIVDMILSWKNIL